MSCNDIQQSRPARLSCFKNKMLSVAEIKKLIENHQIAKFYDDIDWRLLSEEVRREYHNECQICKAKGKITPAVITHHVKHLRQHPELAYIKKYVDKDGKEQIQLLPVCFACHEEQHPERRWSKRTGKYVNDEKW